MFQSSTINLENVLLFTNNFFRICGFADVFSFKPLLTNQQKYFNCKYACGLSFLAFFLTFDLLTHWLYLYWILVRQYWEKRYKFVWGIIANFGVDFKIGKSTRVPLLKIWVLLLIDSYLQYHSIAQNCRRTSMQKWWLFPSSVPGWWSFQPSPMLAKAQV